MIPFPKISLGIKTKKYDHPISHDVNTTYNWGLIQPTLCQYMMADSDITGSFRDFIRLAPLPVPSFAEMHHETDLSFVPIADVVPYFEAMLSNLRYTGSAGKIYTPVELPMVDNQHLMCCVTSNTKFVTYRVMKKDSDSGISAATYHYEDYTYASTNYTTLNQEFQGMVCNTMSTQYKNVFKLPIPQTHAEGGYIYDTYNDLITYDSADLVVRTANHVILFSYTPEGRQLRKVLLGLGYSMQFGDKTPLSLVPLLGFYKAYYDRYEVKRVLSWPVTNCYQLIKFIDDNYYTRFTQEGISRASSTLFNSANKFFTALLEDYSELWYTAPVDYISAQTQSPVAQTGDETHSSPEFIGNDVDQYTQNTGLLPSSKSGAPFDNVMLRSLFHVTRFVNKDSIIGTKIQDYLRVHYGAEVVNNLFKESNHVGNFRTDCSIDTIVSTTENATTDEKDPRSGDFLGSYAGNGSGFREYQINFHAKTQGYLFAMSCIVPHASFFQGNDTSLLPVDVNTIPIPEYDCLGYEIMPKTIVCAGNDVLASQDTGVNEGFGYMPRYSCYKYKKNLVNGDMSRRGSIDTLSPYYSDRIISETTVIGDSSDPDAIKLEFRNQLVPMASTEWRYPTRYDWTGNFNRMFYNAGYVTKGSGYVNYSEEHVKPVDDNFIGQMRWRLTVKNSLMPLGMSYDTFDENDDTGTMTVNKD